MSVGQNTKVHCSISFRSTEYDALVPDIGIFIKTCRCFKPWLRWPTTDSLWQTYHEEENNRMNWAQWMKQIREVINWFDTLLNIINTHTDTSPAFWILEVLLIIFFVLGYVIKYLFTPFVLLCASFCSLFSSLETQRLKLRKAQKLWRMQSESSR